ncbi:NADPH-dependent F420 reductase [Marinomonas profundimaris]|uniref:NADPH-dependent F420 reductase n=1 Tax=Marinomonas profundimaris TaxID=1208321 RepID=W1S2M2_9GAMM|nr:NADPH-dependent F420 reductase [Marinomonas profundimaris]ETI61353.1 NADPH-dependent F420 reductase [Marinomonas profundimaris]
MMNIAILGTGNMAAGFVDALAPKYKVTIGARDPAKAAALAEKSAYDVESGSISAAIAVSDLVLLALPFSAIKDVLSAASNMDKKTLIDIYNPVTEDFQQLSLGHTTSAAEEIQTIVPNAYVVKAFNTIFAPLLPEEAHHDQHLQVLLASDNEPAKAIISEIASSIGFTAIDAGPLKNARFLEPIGAMNIQFGFFLGQGTNIAPIWKHL